MSKRIVSAVRDPGTGAGQSSETVTIKTHATDTTVDTGTTDADGFASFDVEDIGYPGPTYEEYIAGGETKIRSGKVTGQAGLLWLDTIDDVFSGVLGLGVLAGVGDELEISADGATLTLTMGTGLAILSGGQPYLREATDTVTLDAADGSNPRIDRIILRQTLEGETDEGKVILTKLTGTPASSPQAPNLTQNSQTYEFPLAQVRVETGVTSISGDKVTDERAYGFAFPSGAAPGRLLVIDDDGRPAFSENASLALSEDLVTLGGLDASGNSIFRANFTVRFTNATAFAVNDSNGDQVLGIDTGNRIVRFHNNAEVRVYDDSNTIMGRWFGQTGELNIEGPLNHDGSTVGFFGATPASKPTVSGSRGGNAALTSLLTALANLGLITDSTS